MRSSLSPCPACSASWLPDASTARSRASTSSRPPTRSSTARTRRPVCSQTATPRLSRSPTGRSGAGGAGGRRDVRQSRVRDRLHRRDSRGATAYSPHRISQALSQFGLVVGGGGGVSSGGGGGGGLATPASYNPNTNPLGASGTSGIKNPYASQLDSLLTNPSGFSGTPGFQFALDTGMQGVERGMASQRGSGNALAALSKYGTGLAQQDYGNQVDRLGKLSGQQQQYDLGLGQNMNSAQNNMNNFSLGQARNTNDAISNSNNFSLGNARNFNDATRNSNDMNLGMYRAGNDFSLGQATNATNLQRNYWDNENNNQQNANTAARNQNDYNSGMYRNGTDQYNAETNRGNGQSTNYLNLLRLRSGR